MIYCKDSHSRVLKPTKFEKKEGEVEISCLHLLLNLSHFSFVIFLILNVGLNSTSKVLFILGA